MRRPRRPFLVFLGAVALAGASLTEPRTTAAQQAETVSREIAATQDGWTDTGLVLAAGDSARLTASGRATWDGGASGSGPEGSSIESCRPIVPELPVGALLARVGDGRPVVAHGAAVKGPGPLALAYNDCPGQYFDNAGSFAATIEVTRVAPPSSAPAPAQPAPTAAPTTAPDPQSGEGRRGPPLLPALALAVLGLIGAAGFVVWRRRSTTAPRFDASAQLRSSAWLAPIRLRDLQGERRPKRALTVGGPDADIDFGVPDVRARIVPTDDGGARIETAGSTERVLVNDLPLILGQRLGPGYRVRIGMREFVYTEHRRESTRPPDHEQASGLDKPDPRAA
jgi:hypothetical protein